MQEAKLLGKSVAYPNTYCPSILVAVPRKLNREIYDIRQPETLFYGYDSWHCYEASFITDQGLPVSGLLKLVYPADSEYIVESKSLKLYLGSFNMTALGETSEIAVTTFSRTVAEDLSQLLHTSVKARFFREGPEKYSFDFEDYTLLESLPYTENIQLTTYQEKPGLLIENRQDCSGELKVGSHLLKSNCKITHQPDWGSIYIRIKADKLPAESSLLKYIVSLRNENHFHEEICEMTFKRLTDFFHPEILTVSCLYTRRGGIDICPVRANKPEYLPIYLPNPDKLTKRTFRQ